MTTPSRRHGYPSDLTDAQWDRVEPIIPEEKRSGRHRSTDLRKVVNAIEYRLSTGCAWRMVPRDFPPWGTIYTYYREWQQDGTWQDIRKAMDAARKVQASEDHAVSTTNGESESAGFETTPRKPA